MIGESKLLNGIESKASVNGVVASNSVSAISVTSDASGTTIKAGVAGIKTTAKSVSLAAVAVIAGISIGTKVIDPNDFVNSCYGGGYWVEDYPWSETDAWVE